MIFCRMRDIFDVVWFDSYPMAILPYQVSFTLFSSSRIDFTQQECLCIVTRYLCSWTPKIYSVINTYLLIHIALWAVLENISEYQVCLLRATQDNIDWLSIYFLACKATTMLSCYVNQTKNKIQKHRGYSRTLINCWKHSADRSAKFEYTVPNLCIYHFMSSGLFASE